MRRWFRGIDDLAIETAYVGVSALIALVVMSWAINSATARRLDSVPFVGKVTSGFRALVAQVVQ